MTETLDAQTAAIMTITAQKGNAYAEAAARFTAENGLQILHYDRANDLVHLSDGEAYSSGVFYSWVCTRVY